MRTWRKKPDTLCWILTCLFALGLLAPAEGPAAEDVRLHEDFQDLQAWDPLTFEKVERHSRYSIEENETGSFLRAQSDDSASGLVWKGEYDVTAYPHLSWRWKVDRVYETGNAATKEGDDYPLRLYVVFKYDPDKASFWQKVKYGSYKAVYGRYPPHSSLNYIWANRQHEQQIIPNAYTDRAMMIPLRAGPDRVGEWVEESVNVLEDYRRAFGEDPPQRAGLAVMNDSDDTGESSVSWVDDIMVYR